MKHPYYRLFQDPDGFRIDVVLAAVDFDDPSYDPEDSWTHTVKSKEIADVKTREAADAVLRLVCSEYMAWGPLGWDSPMVTLPSSDAPKGETP